MAVVGLILDMEPLKYWLVSWTLLWWFSFSPSYVLFVTGLFLEWNLFDILGGRDGCVRLWDPRVPEPVLALEPGEGQTARDCWTVAFGNSFGDEDRCIAAGYDNGDVKLFDLRMNAMRYETNVGNGVTCIEFDRKDIEMNKMVVSCVYKFNYLLYTHSLTPLSFVYFVHIFVWYMYYIL